MKKDKSNELGLFALVWICLNFIAGITFVCTFNSLVWDGKKGVGLNLLWIDIIEGTTAFICAWSFAKLIQIHPTANGGISQFARTSISKYWGLVGSLLNYMSFPMILSSLIVSTFRTNFGEGSSLNLIAKWGNSGQLYLDLMGLGIFLISTLVVFIGVAKFRKFSFIVGIITWSLTGIILLFGIGALVFNGNTTIEFLAKNASISKVDSESFVNTFVSIFFTFLGVETFFTSGKMIKNRSRNMPIAISIVIFLATIFYIIFGFFIICGNTIDFGVAYDANPAISVFKQWDKKFGTHNAFQTFGSTIIISATILIRFNTMVNINIAGGSTLEPLSKQGYISDKVSEVNLNKNFPVKAMLFTVIVYISSVLLFLILPDVVQAITNKNSLFDFTKVIGFSSVILILIYFLSIISCLNLYFKKKMNLSIFEVIIFISILGFLSFILFESLYGDIVKPYIDGGVQNYLSASLEIIYLLSFLFASFYIYYFYYKKMLKKYEEDPDLREKFLENEKNYIIIEQKIEKPYFLTKIKNKKEI